jgi:UDP-N-acetylglucosamine--N-acetylmuramyl-(pentapeptide) pyrophosphoryl-undecaprenol N-acetylglucosamine transferase
MKVILSGGGTGGHVYPAIAVADALKERMPEVQILFVGAKGRMEMEKVPAAGYEVKGLWISGLDRRLSLRNLLFPVKVLSSVMTAYTLLRKFRPNVVAGFGGYASGPLLRAAVAMGIPVVIQEQNSYAGITNKLLSKQARKICVAYPGMERFFPQKKIVLTGNPVRKDLQDLKDRRAEAMSFFGLDDTKKTLLLFGGSLGARKLNEAMSAQTQFFREHDDIQVLWQMGKLYAEKYATSETANLSNVHAMPFIDKMDLAYAASDVVICRAGALTISELCLAGKAAILVPSPNVAEDHQTKNALALVEHSAAMMVHDSGSPGDLMHAILDILNHPDKKLRLELSIATLAKPDAATRIADLIINEAKS